MLKLLRNALLFLLIPCFAHAGGAPSLMVAGGSAAVSSYNMTINIAADLDDGTIYDSTAAAAGTLDTNGYSGYELLGETTANQYGYGYFRFALSSAIAAGATITTATIRVMAANPALSGWDLSADTLVIRGEDAADPAQIDSANDAPFYAGAGQTAVPLTTASANWTPAAWTADTNYTSPDIKTIIQELVTDNGGLALNAHIQIWMYRTLAAAAERLNAYDYAHATGTEAQLYIEWTQ